MIPYDFGPLWTEEGVIFRLWAPGTDSVRLLLGPDQDRTRAFPMTSDAEGWWRSLPLPAEEGTDYSFLLHDGTAVPDPASRRQRRDVHGPSVLVKPRSHRDGAAAEEEWTGRPWEETVLYEVHVGAGGEQSSRAGSYGTFSGLATHLPALAESGITALELMPIADFPGARNWGYDGVLPFAPDGAYGTPDDLHELIRLAHRNGLSMWLDVVYNHFGPEGNYLHLYAPQFFNKDVNTPWGAGIDFTRPQVRRFFVENALYWIEEYGFDGLRLDAVHAIHDPSEVHILSELAETVRRRVGPGRHVHLVLENDGNEAAFLGSRPDQYTAQWNDDIHHAWHVLLTGESHGYYHEYARNPEAALLQALATGYVRRGETSTHLSPTRFVAFLQNHDQIGNRAFGERLISLTDRDALRAAVASLLLAPQIPLLFMGEIRGAETPFQFFCDFGKDLAEAVRAGRRREFGLEDLPDPIAEETFLMSRPGTLSGPPAEMTGTSAAEWRSWYEKLLEIRSRYLVPLLPDMKPGKAAGGGEEAAVICWEPGWIMELNLNGAARPLPGAAADAADATDAAGVAPVAPAPHRDRELLLGTPGPEGAALMPPWSIRVYRRRP